MQYHAHGKLLISGEYLVLKGAQALAIPTSYGQSLSFLPGNNTIKWQSFDYQQKLWFEADFRLDAEILNTQDSQTAAFLQNLLKAAIRISGCSLPAGTVKMHLEFPQNWGLGSSSTLTHLVAQWLKIDPFELLFTTQNGSGYDIACASSNTPLIYTLKDGIPSATSVTLPPAFENTFFVHLNKKQNSRPAVTNFLKSDSPAELISEVSDITQQMLLAQNTIELSQLMDLHEKLMSGILQSSTIKETLFNDFDGSIKSLGAWGGDFVMALGENVTEYFQSKNFHTIIPFRQMILQ